MNICFGTPPFQILKVFKIIKIEKKVIFKDYLI